MKRICAIIVLLWVASLEAMESQARWIWREGKAENGEVLWLRHEFKLDAVPDGGFIHVAGDDSETFFLNGEKMFTGGFPTCTIDAKRLKAGVNLLAARVRNDVGGAGLLVYGELMVGGRKVIVLTDKSWKVIKENKTDIGWEKPGFDDSSWKNAVEIRGVTEPHVWKSLIKVSDFLSKEEFEVEERENRALLEMIDGSLVKVRARLATETKPQKVEFVRINNVPFISLDDGKKLLSAPYINTCVYKTLVPQNFEKLKRYAAVGYHVAMSGTRMTAVWNADGSIDTTEAEKSLMNLLAAFPDAYILYTISLDPPRWFLDKYPDELIRYGSSKEITDKGDVLTNPVRRPSMASKLWMEQAGEALTKVIENLEKSEGGKRIIGYHLNYGVYAEWHYYGMANQMPDISTPMQMAFTDYLREKYGTDEKLQAAWHDKSVTLENAKIPSNEKRLEQRDGVLIRAGQDSRCPDFYDCLAREVNNCQAFFDRTARKASGRRPLIGNYTGYFFGMAYPAVGYQTRTPEILRTDASDYQTSPFSYAFRASGSSGLPRAVFEAYALNGKVGLLEADNRTHQANIPSTCHCKEDSVGQIAREFCNALTKGATMWYYDFEGWWYDYPEYYELFPKFVKIWSERQDATRISEMAGVCDFDSIPYHTAAVNPNQFTNRICSVTAHEMYYAGAPFDTIFMEDLNNPKTPKYKIYVFYNLVHLTDKKVATVRRLLKDGSTLVFICSPDLQPLLKNEPKAIFAKDYMMNRREFHNLLVANNIHCYIDDIDAVLFASRGLVGIHRKEPGPATIWLPEKPKRIIQLLPERKEIEPTDLISYDHPLAGTSLFRIEK